MSFESHRQTTGDTRSNSVTSQRRLSGPTHGGRKVTLKLFLHSFEQECVSAENHALYSPWNRFHPMRFRSAH